MEMVGWEPAGKSKKCLLYYLKVYWRCDIGRFVHTKEQFKPWVMESPVGPPTQHGEKSIPKGYDT